MNRSWWKVKYYDKELSLNSCSFTKRLNWNDKTNIPCQQFLFSVFLTDKIRFFCNPSIICLQTFKGILIPIHCRYLIQEQIISKGTFSLYLSNKQTTNAGMVLSKRIWKLIDNSMHGLNYFLFSDLQRYYIFQRNLLSIFISRSNKIN